MTEHEYIEAYSKTIAEQMSDIGYDTSLIKSGVYLASNGEDEHIFRIYKRDCGRIGYDVYLFFNGQGAYGPALLDQYPCDLFEIEEHIERARKFERPNKRKK